MIYKRKKNEIQIYDTSYHGTRSADKVQKTEI